MIKLKKNRSDGKCTVTMDGNMTIEYAAELKDVLLKAVDSKGIILDMKKVTLLDLSCIQLLWAARQSMAEKGMQIESRGALPEVIRIKQEEAGFEAIL